MTDLIERLRAAAASSDHPPSFGLFLEAAECIASRTIDRATAPRLVYVAGPYRAPMAWGIEQNIRRAAEVAARVWQAGLVAICPHLNAAHMEGVATDAQFLAGTLEMLRRCDAVILVPGWEPSAGSRAEVNEADRLGLPVFGLTKRTSEGSDINSLEWGLTEMNRWVVDGSLPHGEVLPYALGGD